MSGGEIVVVKRGGGDGSRYPLESGAATLGRGLSCDIRVLLSTVSDEQCVVTVHKNQALIKNLSDINPTLVNGKPVQLEALYDGDIITMGDRSLRWEYFNKERNIKSKMPTGKIKFTKKKRTGTAASSGRRSEVATRRIDPQVKKILDLKTRASLGDMHTSTRQIAVVKPQRRSADPPSDEAAGERPGAPGTPSRRRGERGLEASESHTQVAETKENRTSSASNFTIMKAVGKLLTPKPVLPQSVKNATPKRGTPKLSAKKRKTTTAGKNSTPHYVNVEKIDDPLTLDANKKVALLLLTGRRPVKKILPTTATKAPEKAGSKRQTPAKAGSSRKNTPKFVIKQQSPIRTPKNTGTPKGSLKNGTLKGAKPAVTPKKEEAIASPKTPKGKKLNPKTSEADFTPIPPTKAVVTPKTSKSVAKPRTPKETQTSAITPENTASTSSISIGNSSARRKTATPESRKVSLADGCDVLKSIPNVSDEKSNRVSSARRKTATPQSKTSMLASESDIIESTPDVDARKSKRDSSGGRKSATPLSKNASLANESYVFKSIPNVADRKSIRDSSAKEKTATPESRNASLADESDILENSPKLRAQKSARDSSDGQKSVTPKPKTASSAAHEYDLSQSTRIPSARKSVKDSSGRRKTTSPKLKIESYQSGTVPTISISSPKKSKTSDLQQTQILDRTSLSSGRKSALKSPNHSVRKNESIKFDLSNLEKGDENNSPSRGRKRKSHNMTGDSDIDLKLRFSDITEPSPRESLAEYSKNQPRSCNISHKTMTDSQVSLSKRMSDVSRQSNISTLNASTLSRSPHSAMIVERASVLHESYDINTSAKSTQISRLSTKFITETIDDSDLDKTVESNKSQNVTRDKSKNGSRARNSTIFLDTTDDSLGIDTPKEKLSRRTSRKSGIGFTPDGYSIVDLVSDQSSNNVTMEKTTPGMKTPSSTLKTFPSNPNTSVNVKTRKSLINNKFVQSFTSTPLKKYNSLIIDNLTPVSSPIATGKGPRLSVRSSRKTLSPKKTSPISRKKTSSPLSKSLTISDTKSPNVLGYSASTGSPVNRSRKSSNKGTPSVVSVSRKSNRASVTVPASLYEDISETLNSRRSKSLGTPLNISADKVIKNMRTSTLTPENKFPQEGATTPVLSVTDLLNASKASFKRMSIRNKIDHFECMSTPKTPVATQKVTRKTLGAIGDRINRRKSDLESLADEKKTRTDPRKVTRGIVKKNQKNKSLNVSAVKKISAHVNKKNDQSLSEQESVASDTTDVNAQKPENDIVITPKSTIKLVPEILKEKHSTAKKPFSRKSIIDHLNESQEMVKELFRSPVKRKLSQSMVQYGAMQDSDEEFNESINALNDRSIRDKPKNKRLSALSKQTLNQTPNVTFDFDSVKTPHVPTDVFVSPLDDPDKRQSPRNSLSNFVGVKKLFSRNTPKNDLTDVRGLKSLMRTPGVKKSPKNDLTQVPTVKTLFATNKKKAKSPRNDLTEVQGVKKIFQSPRHQKSPRNDLTNVTGVKKMLKTPMQQKSPHNDLTKIPNVRNLFLSPGHGRKSPRNDLSNVSGVTKLFRNPRSPKNTLQELSGIEDLFNSSSSTLKEGETSNGLFDKLIGKTPPKHTYQKSKSFVKDKKEPSSSRANKSMCPLEIIENHVEDWLDKELERRTRKDSDISKNDEEVNTSQSKKDTPRKLNKSSKKKKMAIETSKPGSSRKGRVNRELGNLVIDAVGGDVEITPNRRARRLVTQEKSNYSLEVSKATPSKITKSTQKILLPLKKRSISNEKFRISGVKVTPQNLSKSQSALNVSQSPNSRPTSRLSAHSEAEMSLPLKKRTILKNDGALGHSTPVKKKLSPKKGQDSSIVDLGHVSPISKSSKDTPQQIESQAEEKSETPNGTECIEDSTANTRRGVHRRAATKNKSSAKVEKSTRTQRFNTENLSKPNSPESNSPRLVLEKKSTPKFSPKYKSEQSISDESMNTEKSPKKRDSLNLTAPKLNVAKRTLTRSTRGKKNVTGEIIDKSNFCSVSAQEKVTTPKRTRKGGKQDKVESSLQAEDIVAEVTNPKNTITPVSLKAGRSRGVKKGASIDSPQPKPTRGRGKNCDSVQNETVDTKAEVVVEIKKPARGRGKGKKNMTIETNDTLEISVSESNKVSSLKEQPHSVENNISVEDSTKPTLKKVQKATSKVVEEIANIDNVSIKDSPKPVPKRGRKAAAKVVPEIQGDVLTQDSPKPTKRGRKAIKDDISVQDSPKPVAKRGRRVAVHKVVEGPQEESTNKDEVAVLESPKPVSKRVRKPVSKAVEDSPKQSGRRKRVVEEKELVTEEVKPSSPKKGRGRSKVVKNNTEADVSNAENAKVPSGRRKKEEPVSETKKVTFSESTSDEISSLTKPAPKGRASRRKAADEAEVESVETSAKSPEGPPKRARRGAQLTTDSSAEVTKTTRGKKTTKVVSPTKSPVEPRSTRAKRQKK